MQSQISINYTSIGNRFPLHFADDSDCFMNILIKPWQTAPSVDWWSKYGYQYDQQAASIHMRVRRPSVTSWMHLPNPVKVPWWLPAQMRGILLCQQLHLENAAFTPHLSSHRTSLMCSNLHNLTCRRLQIGMDKPLIRSYSLGNWFCQPCRVCTWLTCCPSRLLHFC